jgi:preprotein translocase subunit SecA
MFGVLAKKFFGTVNDRLIKQYNPIVIQINALEDRIAALSDDELKNQTSLLKAQIKEGKSLDDILPEAFATCREVSKRVLGMRHFDVQLVGGLALHNGMIAEMKTGEGKTLVSTLAVYLNALTEKGVHIVTVNDYLAKRDSEWMGTIYRFLGLSVGCITGDILPMDRKEAYACDITYGTNNEFGFDYLRDNLKYSFDELTQREPNFAVIDEVDSILIDEARTPLIISGPTEDSSELYLKINKLIPELTPDEYEIDEKSKTATFNDQGIEKVEVLLSKAGLFKEGANLYDVENISLVHHLNQALRAHLLFKKDVDYIVKKNEVLIIDEFTGRMMEGRRYSEGLHQALEAKEKVAIQTENQTIASVTFQNYFRLYPKLSGMTGTAMTEAAEFKSIYDLDVLAIPTNRPVSRKDDDDVIYKNAHDKHDAIIVQIKECYERKQPVLVGTVSIEKSELLAKMLRKEKIPHNILNAKHHLKEATIISQAGSPAAVTIATNMAGRGTDIKLGGNEEILIDEAKEKIKDEEKLAKEIAAIEARIAVAKEIVIKAGGLYVLGTERHESRRIDNQLRGRSGRQGDAGASKFFLSLEDDLMRIFGSDRIKGMLEKLGFKDGEAIHHPWISRALEKAQQKVEANNFEIRKNLLKYDDVMNEQRKVIYSQRKDILKADNVSVTIEEMRGEINKSLIHKNIPQKSMTEMWDLETLEKEIFHLYGLDLDVQNIAEQDGANEKLMLAKINGATEELFNAKEQKYGRETIDMMEKNIFLMTLDSLWKDHLNALDHLKTGINLRAYGQKDPLNEYKHEAFAMFDQMFDLLREKTIRRLVHAELSDESQQHLALDNLAKKNDNLTENHPELNDKPLINKIGRNEHCPCNSGKKFKHCHGRIN